MLLTGEFERHADATAHEIAGPRLAAHSVMLGLPEEPLAARVEKSQAQRGRGGFHAEVAGGQPRRVALRDLEGRGWPATLAHVSRAGRHASVVELHAHDAGRADGEGDARAVIRIPQAGLDALVLP